MSRLKPQQQAVHLSSVIALAEMARVQGIEQAAKEIETDAPLLADRIRKLAARP